MGRRLSKAANVPIINPATIPLLSVFWSEMSKSIAANHSMNACARSDRASRLTARNGTKALRKVQIGKLIQRGRTQKGAMKSAKVGLYLKRSPCSAGYGR